MTFREGTAGSCRVQDGGMSAHLRCADAWLLLGDQQIAVEVDLGLFLPDTGLWGGVLRHVWNSSGIGGFHTRSL